MEALAADLRLADADTRPVGARVFAAARIIVVNHGDTFDAVCGTIPARGFDLKNPSWGLSRLAEAVPLRIPSREYLRDGKLTVRVEMYS